MGDDACHNHGDCCPDSSRSTRYEWYNLRMSHRFLPALALATALLSLLAACSSGGGGSTSGGVAGGGGDAAGQGGSGGGVTTGEVTTGGGGGGGQGGAGAAAGEGQLCGSSANDAMCGPGLACCYPCGIRGCDFVCTVACDPSEPGCANGCIPAP